MSNSALIEDLERQFTENPRRVFARLANEYRKSGNLDGAIALCREHVPRHPGYISGHIVLGQALFESGGLDEARLSFEAALQLDPENLIALRHLGDIARQGGDLDEASSWYRRLLEVDPQNEDVAARLIGLADLAVAAPVVPLLDVADTTGGEGALPAAMPPEDDDPVAESESEPIDWSDINPENHSDAADAASPEDMLLDETLSDGPIGAHAHTGADDAAFHPFGEASFAAPAETREGSDPDAGLAAEELADARAADFASDAIEPESGPFDDPANRSGSAAFDMPREEILTFGSEQAEQGIAAESEEGHSFGHSTEREGNGVSDAPETNATANGVDDSADATATRPGNTDDEVHFPNGEGGYPAFVTETVADVYERQGHLSQALEVYRQLAEQHPANEMLRAHVARLESAMTPAEPAADGSSIRAIFARVMQRRVPASAAGPPASDLFPGAAVSAADDKAASALAAAFSPEFGGDLAERGRPARAAEDELSLESVFGNPPAAHPDPTDVSFDEFFPDSGRGGGTEAANGPAKDTPGDDEIFHSWLDGLKR